MVLPQFGGLYTPKGYTLDRRSIYGTSDSYLVEYSRIVARGRITGLLP